jgi:hypothetical protein
MVLGQNCKHQIIVIRHFITDAFVNPTSLLKESTLFVFCEIVNINWFVFHNCQVNHCMFHFVVSSTCKFLAAVIGEDMFHYNEDMDMCFYSCIVLAWYFLH